MQGAEKRANHQARQGGQHAGASAGGRAIETLQAADLSLKVATEMLAFTQT